MKKSAQDIPLSSSEMLKKQRVNKRKLILLAVLAVIAVAAYIGYGLYKERAHRIKKNLPVVTIEGEEYRQLDSEAQPSAKNTTTNRDLIQGMEAKIASGRATYRDYVNLANLYLSTGNKAKALKNYEIAKAKADPKMPGYKSFLEFINQAISRLKGSG